MRRLFVLMIAMLMIGNLALAEEENWGCVIEDWRYYKPYEGWLAIEGTTTCKSGFIYIRVYQSGKYKGNTMGVIDHHVFDAGVENILLNDDPIEIKYGVNER